MKAKKKELVAWRVVEVRRDATGNAVVVRQLSRRFHVQEAAHALAELARRGGVDVEVRQIMKVVR